MKLKMYQIDAFTDSVFKGNPAAVCPLSAWLPDEVMQQIAAENNLAETAFLVPQGDRFEIRWFTPVVEVALCGHATLAAAFALYHVEGLKQQQIEFYSPLSGSLPVRRHEDKFVLHFPADHFTETLLTDDLLAATNKKPLAAYKGKTDYMLVFGQQEDIESMQPDLPLIAGLAARGLIVTAAGRSCDFVSRFFAPAAGINEDPVTGSAHTTLTPYWAGQLGKTDLLARQLSERGGELHCRFMNERVDLAGSAVLYMSGHIFI